MCGWRERSLTPRGAQRQHVRNFHAQNPNPPPVYLGDNVIYFPCWLEDARFVVFAGAI
jgi:hypothetical protein